MLRSVIFILFFVMLVSFSSPAYAEDMPIKVVFTNSFYGGVVGGTLGLAAVAFTADRSAHVGDFAFRGAAYGVFIGTAFGFFQLRDYFVSVDHLNNDQMAFGLPAVRYESSTLGGKSVERYTAEIFRYNF